MQQLKNNPADYDIDYRLDITEEVCPLTFVKTKLLIERMKPGQIAAVRLKGSEPLENVPRSLKELGHTVLGLDAEESGEVFLLLMRKEGAAD